MKGLTYIGTAIDDKATYSKLPKELQHILNETNGYIAFGGGFHLRGVCSSPDWHSINAIWKGEYALSKLFTNVLSTDIPFAEDCLGDQFIIREGNIMKLLAETGEIEDMETNIADFFANIESNPVEFLLLQPLMEYYADGGKLEPGQLLFVYPPFCTTEASDKIYQDQIDSMQLLMAHARLSQELSKLSPGESFNIREMLK
jgi:hypothetical protein